MRVFGSKRAHLCYFCALFVLPFLAFVLKVLLEHKANTEARNYNQYTSLYTAVLNSNVEIVKMLVDGGANTEARMERDNKNTSILQAAKMGNEEIGVLVISGLNPSYVAPASLKFNDAVKNVDTVVYTGERFDETSEYAHYFTPNSRWLCRST